MHADEFTDCPNVSTSKGNRREKFMRQSTEHKHSLTYFVCFSMADKRKRLQNEISSIYFIFCVQSFGAQFVNFNVLMRILRRFFHSHPFNFGPYRCTAFSLPVSLIIAFFVVNFPLILTDNFLLKSKLSRFPSHSIRFRMYLDYNDWRCILCVQFHVDLCGSGNDCIRVVHMYKFMCMECVVFVSYHSFSFVISL